MKRHHPLWQAPVGSVFAIQIRKNKWGFVRFFHGLKMAVLSLVSNAPLMPDGIDWKNPPIGWLLISFATDNDPTEAVPLGIVPFPNLEAEWGPAYVDPWPSWQPRKKSRFYGIHHLGRFWHGTKEEAAKLPEIPRVTPAELQVFLRKKLRNGELKRVDPVAPTKAPKVPKKKDELCKPSTLPKLLTKKG